MTNIEKVKRILDAGHWVKVSYEYYDDSIVTSYIGDSYSYIEGGVMYEGYMAEDISENCTIEVIQRIPTEYKSGDKVLVLSNPTHISKVKERMVGTVCKVKDYLSGTDYKVFNEDGEWFNFPVHCLSPVFDDEEISDLDRIISGKEAKIVIDGKEYTCVIK